MEQFLPLIVIAGLSLLTNYLNKKAERDQQDTARKLQENSGKQQRSETRPSMSEAQSQPAAASEGQSTLTDWSTWHRSSEDRSRDMGQTPDRRDISPSSAPRTNQPESREGHSPVRRFWDELNDAAKEWSESMAAPPPPSPKPVPSNIDSSPKPIAVAKSSEIKKANELASAALRTAQKGKRQIDDRLGKNKLKLKNPWDLSSSREKKPRSLAKTMLKKPSTARQAIALSMILAPPKALAPDEDHWFSR